MKYILMREPLTVNRDVRRVEAVPGETKAGQKKKALLEDAGYSVCGILETETAVSEIADGLSWKLVGFRTAVQNLIIEMEDIVNERKK